MDAALEFSPLLDWPLLAGLAALSLGAVVLAFVMGAAGWALRGLAALALLTALANPSLRQELRDPLPDIAFLVVDSSAGPAGFEQQSCCCCCCCYGGGSSSGGGGAIAVIAVGGRDAHHRGGGGLGRPGPGQLPRLLL